MLEIESSADRAGFFKDSADIALFAQIDDALDDEGASSIIVERNVECLFDRAYIQVGNTESYHPVALCRDEDLVYLKTGHRVMIKGHVWRVDERMPDGTGFTQLLLKKIGGYRYDRTDANVQAGFPYTLPVIFGNAAYSQDDPRAANADTNVQAGFPYFFPLVFGNDEYTPGTPRLAYPYTVKTYFDWTPGTESL